MIKSSSAPGLLQINSFSIEVVVAWRLSSGVNIEALAVGQGLSVCHFEMVGRTLPLPTLKGPGASSAVALWTFEGVEGSSLCLALESVVMLRRQNQFGGANVMCSKQSSLK